MLVKPLAIGQRTSAQLIAAAAAVIGIAASLLVEPNAQGIVGAALAMLMIAIAFVDARHFVIPDELNIAALALAFMNLAIFSNETATEAIPFAIMRGAALSLVFLGLRIAYRKLRKREGLGLGDVKLAGVAGAWLSWQTIPIAVDLAALAALAAYSMHCLTSERGFRITGRLPFGLFFAPAIWLGWLFETIWLQTP
jgi:leader peptidase (prepilin peptidase) / N-methyltransferase